MQIEVIPRHLSKGQPGSSLIGTTRSVRQQGSIMWARSRDQSSVRVTDFDSLKEQPQRSNIARLNHRLPNFQGQHNDCSLRSQMLGNTKSDARWWCFLKVIFTECHAVICEKDRNGDLLVIAADRRYTEYPYPGLHISGFCKPQCQNGKRAVGPPSHSL